MYKTLIQAVRDARQLAVNAMNGLLNEVETFLNDPSTKISPRDAKDILDELISQYI